MGAIKSFEIDLEHCGAIKSLFYHLLWTQNQFENFWIQNLNPKYLKIFEPEPDKKSRNPLDTGFVRRIRPKNLWNLVDPRPEAYVNKIVQRQRLRRKNNKIVNLLLNCLSTLKFIYDISPRKNSFMVQKKCHLWVLALKGSPLPGISTGITFKKCLAND